MSYTFYKMMHFIGLFLLFSSLGGMLLHYGNGGRKDNAFRKWTGMLHGISLLLILVGGFGLLARIGESFNSGWVISKLAIWFFFGGIIVLIRKKPKMAKSLWLAITIVGGAAAYLALTKPF